MKNVVIFGLGMVTGIAISTYVFKKRLEEMDYVEEVDEDIEYDDPDEEVEEERTVEDIREQAEKIMEESGYTGKEEKKTPDIEIIPPEEFDVMDDYTTIQLNWYANGVMTDDIDDPMSEDEIISAIGSKEPLEHFGEYEEDTVFVRNNVRKIDYEIVRTDNEYEEE